jgi:hypothetical protein
MDSARGFEQMTQNVLVIISSGEEAVDKALTGMMYALNVKKSKWLDDVNVIFFGPSERMIAKADSNSQVGAYLKQLMEQGITPVACRAIAERENLGNNLSALGLNVEYVGHIISSYIKKDYQVLTF